MNTIEKEFALNKVLKVKKAYELQKEVEIMNVNNLVKTEREILNKKSQEIKDVIYKTNSLETKTINDLRISNVYLNVLRDEASIIKENIRYLKNEKNNKIKEWTEIRKDVNLLEKVKEKHIEEYNYYQKKKEEKENQNLAYSRRMSNIIKL